MISTRRRAAGASFGYNRGYEITGVRETVRGPSGLSRAVSHLAYTLISGLLTVVLCAGIMAWLYEDRYQGRIYPGVYVMGVPIGGLTPESASERLGVRLGPSALPYVLLYDDEQEWLVSAAALGGSLDLEGAVREALALGRCGVFRKDLVTRFRLAWYGYQIIPDFQLDEGLALTGLRRIARQVASPVRAGRMSISGLEVRRQDPQSGWNLDYVALRQDLLQQVDMAMGESHWLATSRASSFIQGLPVAASSAPEHVRVPLTFREVTPPLTDAEAATQFATNVLSAPIMLTASIEELGEDGYPYTVQRHWVLDQATLASFLKVEPDSGGSSSITLDGEPLLTWLRGLAQTVERDPHEPRFDYSPESGELTVVSPGQIGYYLDLSAAQELVLQAAASAEGRQVALPGRSIAPRVTRRDLEALLPLSLISVGETSFAGSTPERLQNIRTAAASFHGVVVPPRRTFTFLDHLGPVTAANGYTESWVIVGDRTILGPGGGVCQVSTTAYRAAFWGGYPIEERWPHTYRVGWYEPPLGLDAAVYSPGTDMKFFNDTDTPILILTQVDEAQQKLYFRFYGAPPARTVRMEGPITSRPVPAGPPVFIEDPSLPPGAQILDESARDGLDVTLYRVIEQGGEVVAREEVFSRYVPWPAKYRVGPAPSPQ